MTASLVFTRLFLHSKFWTSQTVDSESEQGLREEMMLATYIVQVDNEPGMLERVAGLIRRRAVEIRSLTAGEADTSQTLRLTIQVEADGDALGRLESNLCKLRNTSQVHNVTNRACLMRELAIIKVAATNEERVEIMQIARIFRSSVIDVCRGSMVVEATGTEAKLNALIDALGSYGIIEIARTGRVAMIRGAIYTGSGAHSDDDNLRKI